MNIMVKLSNYHIYKLDIPLKRPFITSIRTSNNLVGIFYQVELSDGSIGYGESAENIKLTGETREDMYQFSDYFFTAHLQKEIEDTLIDLQELESNGAARYGMETAILDAVAKTKSIEISDELDLSLGNRVLENDTTISLLGDNETILETKRVLKRGYQHIKYKVDNGDSEIQRIVQLEKIIPDDVSIRLDPNQSWTYQETIDAIKTFDDSSLNVEFIEQPVKASMYEEMRKISFKTTIPIIADESVFNLTDAKNVIENGYGTAINIKLIKCGGPLEAIEIANYAKRKEVDCLFGCTTESNVAMTIASYLSDGLSNVKYIDLDGLDYISDSPFIGGVEDKKGLIMLPQQDMGLGIDLLKNKANKYITEF